jgi:hypothetical protein
MHVRVILMILGISLSAPASAVAASVHPDVITAIATGSTVTVSWGPIPSDLGYSNGMYEAFLGKKGFHGDSNPGDFVKTCRVSATTNSCALRGVASGNWDVVVYATSTTNQSYASRVISVRVGTAPPAAAVGLRCTTIGVIKTSKGRYLECGVSKKWRLVNVKARCVLDGAIAGELYCAQRGSFNVWVAPSVAECASGATSIRAGAMQCMQARYARNQPNASITIKLTTSPTVHSSARTWIQTVLRDALRMYAGYPGFGNGTIHAYFSLDKAWCMEKLQALTGTRDDYLCNQDGGLNAGSLYGSNGWVARQSILFGRPYPGNPSLNDYETQAAGTLLNENDWALHFVYEMGHATHGLLMSQITGEGQTTFVPVLLEVGAARMAAYAYVVGVLGQSETRWRATVFEREAPSSGAFTPYSDPRLLSGGSYEGDAIEWPRVYTLGFLAGEYIVGKYGDEVLFDRLIPAVMRNSGNFDAALQSIIGISEDELIDALNEYALAQLRAAGHTITVR